MGVGDGEMSLTPRAEAEVEFGAGLKKMPNYKSDIIEV